MPTDFIHHQKKGRPLCPHRLLWFHRWLPNVFLLELYYQQIDEDDTNKIFAAHTVHMLRNYNDKLVLQKPAGFSVIKPKLILKLFIYELHTFTCWHVLLTLTFLYWIINLFGKNTGERCHYFTLTLWCSSFNKLYFASILVISICLFTYLFYFIQQLSKPV